MTIKCYPHLIDTTFYCEVAPHGHYFIHLWLGDNLIAQDKSGLNVKKNTVFFFFFFLSRLLSNVEPNTEPELATLRSRPKLRSRVRCLTK